jgi:hypothetical protein
MRMRVSLIFAKRSWWNSMPLRSSLQAGQFSALARSLGKDVLTHCSEPFSDTGVFPSRCFCNPLHDTQTESMMHSSEAKW